MSNVFDKQKKEGLNGIDLSRKGSFDEHIHDLIVYINSLDNFFTTSSCSGRIVLFSEGITKKKGCNWLLSSHDSVEATSVIEALSKEHACDKIISLKYESFILHVQSRSQDDAQNMVGLYDIGTNVGFQSVISSQWEILTSIALPSNNQNLKHLKVALDAGYRNSGMMIGKKKKYMVAVRSTHGLEVPLRFPDGTAVSIEYIKNVVTLTNEKLQENFNRTNRFFDGVKKQFELAKR